LRRQRLDRPLNLVHIVSYVELLCDQCGELIQRPEHGSIEWKSVAPAEHPVKARGIRIVHAHGFGPNEKGCYYQAVGGLVAQDEVVGDKSLVELQRGDGIVWILGKKTDKAITEDEADELLKRLYVKHYDRARSHFKSAIEDGILDKNVPFGCWPEADLKRVVDWIDGRENGV